MNKTTSTIIKLTNFCMTSARLTPFLMITSLASTSEQNPTKHEVNHSKKNLAQIKTTPTKLKKTMPGVTQPSSASSESKSLGLVQTKYKNISTITSEFVQKQKNITLGTTKESSGRLYIKRPNKFRWETTHPEPSILVGNGKKVWFYTAPFRAGEKGQVLTKRAADVQSRLAIDLLSGQSDSNKDFKINDLLDRTELIPIKPAGDVARIELFIEKTTNLVYKLILFTKSGNETELTLKNVTLGPNLPDTMFSFVAPPNTEEIQ